MTVFLRLLADEEKSRCLVDACDEFRRNAEGVKIYTIAPNSFRSVPGARLFNALNGVDGLLQLALS
jgi:hypothetical protein